MTRMTPEAPPAKPLPYRVARWGKFPSLEPLFADERSYLIAKGSLSTKVDDIVLAQPAHGNRRTVTEVLGTVTDVAAVLRALLYSSGMPQGFSDEVRAEARGGAARAEAVDVDRRDLTTLPTFTIDPDTARDFDDAISVCREGDGYRAHVHIADVSYFVAGDGAIDREARRRTSSIYLPLFVEPMLPAELSSDLCSLVPRQPRKCLTVEFSFAADGRRTEVQFYRSLIASDHRLTYSFVDTVIAPATTFAAGATALAAEPSPAAVVPDATTQADAALSEQLTLAAELAQILRRRRFARGALVLGSFEPEFEFDAEGKISSATMRPETPSHALVEEFMLAANEAVAEFLLRKRAKTLFRVHEPPAAASIRELLDALEELNVPTPPFSFDEALPAAEAAKAFARVSQLVAETSAREKRGRQAWPTLLLRSLKQARYAPQNLGHFGLASPAYLHFTSPIRRYPDLITHRALLHQLGVGGAELGEAELAAAGEDCSRLEREISKLELMGDDIALAALLEADLAANGWERDFSGEIIGLVGSGLFVRFAGVYEGFVPARKLGGERFEPSRHETALVGETSGRRYRLGDQIDVRVTRVDRIRGRVDLLPAAAAADEKRGRRPGEKPSGREGDKRGGSSGRRQFPGRPRSRRYR